MTSETAEVYAREAFRSFPKLLTLVDRNRLSATYGCFDRQHWHYKTADFPAGMAETGALPLALAYTHRFPGGEGYHGLARLAELAVAAVRFAARSAHRDGSCDDYFPYERALGATAFSLYTLAETCSLLDVHDADLVAFLTRRADWLMAHDESGRLSNHQALCALALSTAARVTGQSRFREGARRRVARVLSWQTGEGWFWEYEGADPGYQTATIDFLAKYRAASGDTDLLAPLARAVDFCRYFVHPDGSYGGGYGSRNTYNVFPAGFEILASEIPEAGAVAAALRHGMAEGRRAYADDDRIFFHWVWDYLQAYLHHKPLDGPPPALGARTRHFTEARLYVRDEPGRYTVLSLAKGGVLAVFDDAHRLYSDHGLVGRFDDGRIVVSQLLDDYRSRVEGDVVTVEGRFGYARRLRPTPWRQIAFRLFTLTVGRLASDVVRRMLQRLLIVGKRRAGLAFRRTIRFTRPLTIVDEVWWEDDSRGRRVTELYVGSDHTAIYVATSQVFQESALQPWQDYGPQLPALAAGGRLRVERTLA
jgi:hypothetical protein